MVRESGANYRDESRAIQREKADSIPSTYRTRTHHSQNCRTHASGHTGQRDYELSTSSLSTKMLENTLQLIQRVVPDNKLSLPALFVIYRYRCAYPLREFALQCSGIGVFFPAPGSCLCSLRLQKSFGERLGLPYGHLFSDDFPRC